MVKPEIRPRKCWRLPYMSKSRSTGWPMRRRASWVSKSPKQMVADFYKRDPQGDIDRIFARILKDSPAVKEAEAKLVQAQRNLDQAKLNLRYCDVWAEIDGVVTRRNVNPGNNLIVG